MGRGPGLRTNSRPSQINAPLGRTSSSTNLLSAAARYAIPFIAVSIASVFRFYLDPTLSWKAPFIFYFLAILLSARYGGVQPGLLATALSVLAGKFLFVESRFSLRMADRSDAINLVLFGMVGIAISVICGQLKAALGSSKLLLAAVVDSSDDAIITADLDGVISSWNRGAERLFGYSAHDLVGGSITKLAPPDRVFETLSVLQKLRSGETVVGFESEGAHKNGQRIPVSLSVSAVKDMAGNIVATSAILRDISHQKQAEAALRRSEAEFREAQRVGHVGSWQTILDSNTRVWSEETYRILGIDPARAAFSVEELKQILTAESWSLLSGATDSLVTTGTAYELDLEFLRPDRTTGWVTATGEAVKDASGKIVMLRGTIQDITKHKQDAEALRQLNENLEDLVARRTAELQTILDTAPIPIWIAHDAKCSRITGNPYAEQTIMQVARGGNMAASAAAGGAAVSYKAFDHGRELRPDELPTQLATTTGQPVRDRAVDLMFSDGRSASLLLSAVPLFDSEGKVRGAVTAGVDVTKIRAAEQFNESVLNSLSAMVAVIAADGTILATNGAWNVFAKDNGDPPADSVGIGANYLQACQNAASQGFGEARQVLDGIQAVIEGRCACFQTEYACHSSAEQRWFLMNASPLKGLSKGAVITHTNISDRKSTETALQRSESTIRALLASAPQSVIAVRQDETIVFVDGDVPKMFGYQPEELLGQSLSLLIPESSRSRHAEHHQGYFADMRTRPMGIGFDLEARRKDGSSFPVEIGLSVIETADGKLAVAFVNDITERKRLRQAERAHADEVQALASRLLTAQEDERRRLARELHDQICQQLAYISMQLGDLMTESEVQQAKPRLEALQRQAIEAAETTRHLAHELHPSILDDLGVVASLQSLCGEFSEKTGVFVDFTHNALPASIRREVSSCLYRVTEQSLQNIAQHSGAKEVSVTLSSHAGDVVLSIEDDGVGFDLDKIAGKGSLGLTSMKERARLIRGTLFIVAKRGHGTKITLEVPSASV